MSRFNLINKKFGKYDVVVLTDEKTGASASVALQGAMLLDYFVKWENNLFNILDGYASPEEIEASRGARNWVMTPFANRISKGEYVFEGELYKLKPIPPRNEVIHGFTSYECFDIKEVNKADEFIEVTFFTDKLRPDVNPGYPFAINLFIKYRFEENKITIEVTGENVGDKPAPFSSGWHPYFRTSDKGINHLIVTINADKVIILDDKYIPLPGKSAYRKVKDLPNLNFNENVPEKERVLGSRELNNCYVDLIKDNDDFSVSSVYDPENGMRIDVFQKGGVNLAYSGDQLSSRPRKAIALEPMQFMTDAFNREELKDIIKVKPGEKSVFVFGISVNINNQSVIKK